VADERRVAVHGSDVRWGRATHGCVGVPGAFARRLFAAAKEGDVWCASCAPRACTAQEAASRSQYEQQLTQAEPSSIRLGTT
jgi:hypothetical protein